VDPLKCLLNIWFALLGLRGLQLVEDFAHGRRATSASGHLESGIVEGSLGSAPQPVGEFEQAAAGKELAGGW
jgi:hypothetical protein